MSRTFVLIMGFVLVVLVATFSLAVHYRHQGDYYRQQWQDALAKLTAEPVVSAPSATKADESRVVYVKTPAPSDDGEQVLRERIATLEHQLAEKDSQLAALRATATSRTPSAYTSAVSRVGFFGWSGTNDVARRAEFDKRRKEMQQTIQTAFAKKASFLLNRDTAKMSEGEKKEYEQMVSLLDETWKMAAQMQQPDLPPDQRREAMHTMRDNVRALDPLLTTERTRQFRDLGTSLGYSGQEADNFVNYIADVIEVTDASSMVPHFHGSGSGGSGRSGGSQSSARQ